MAQREEHPAVTYFRIPVAEVMGRLGWDRPQLDRLADECGYVSGFHDLPDVLWIDGDTVVAHPQLAQLAGRVHPAGFLVIRSSRSMQIPSDVDCDLAEFVSSVMAATTV